MDTGIIDNDSKWRQAVGEITPDYQDMLFPLGYTGILAEAIDVANEEMVQSFASQDFKEGVAHFLQKRAPVFTGK